MIFPFSTVMQKLLLLSNGHGEDAIAARIAEQCQNLSNPPELSVLPIVGEGHAYQKLNIPLLAPVQKMPSGGFIYMDSRQLWRDIQGGLLNLTLSQHRAVKQWGKEGGKILAVGDIVPLLFAWLSGAEYAFVGTAKSEYYLRDQSDWLPSTNGLMQKLGSDYFPWERWLLSRPHCKGVFPRDGLTSENLRRFGIPAFDLGNPMMDGLHSDLTPPDLPSDRLPEIILLLPGSRSPEVLNNWQTILQAVQHILQTWPDRPWLFLTAIAPSLSLEEFETALITQNWQRTPSSPLLQGGPGGMNFNGELGLITNPQTLIFRQNQATLLLCQHSYNDYLHLAQTAIAMAGTATEQFVGLGKPVFTIPGLGPQFTPTFAQRQTYLLGASVILSQKPEDIPHKMQQIFQNSQKLAEIAQNGRQRLGEAGAALKIATHLQTLFTN